MRSCIFLVMILFSSLAYASDDIVGKWENIESKAQVEIYKLNGRFYGRIISLPRPVDEHGALKRDRKNPDKKLQSAPIVGLVIMRDLVYDKQENYWNQGSLYNPHDGNSYKCHIKLKDRNTMSIRGYVGFSLFGKSSLLRRIN